MPRQKLTLSPFTESLAGFLKYSEKLQNTNEIEHKKLLKIVTKIVTGELTKRQKECITMHYYNNLNITQIATELNIDKSTASRHVTRAKNKLKKLLEYYI